MFCPRLGGCSRVTPGFEVCMKDLIRIGGRLRVLNDLPVASLMQANKTQQKSFKSQLNRISQKLKKELGWDTHSKTHNEGNQVLS